MGKPPKETRVAVVGAGLVGAACASVLAGRGYRVDVYDYREDIRKKATARGRSINLALSTRGRTALRRIGVEEEVLSHGIPLRGRMVHARDGAAYSIPYDPTERQCIYSVSRKYLNEVLLTAAERQSNVALHFGCKLTGANLDGGVLTFRSESETFEVTADWVIGADGAHSTVRRELLKRPMFNFSQEYIEHGYLELCIPATADGKFALPENFLHIWPRGSFMMIALPNRDASWTVTLFMPFTRFAEIDSSEKLLLFFREHFADALPLIGEDRLRRDFFGAEPSPLMSVKCRPYHLSDRALILGDAAHAMVPFYGQGMNAGFEDCVLLERLLCRHGDDLQRVLPEFSRTRNPDAEAICDLAMYNYIEMRDLVNRKSYLLRKKLDDALHRAFPDRWIPLYNAVTFTEMPYGECLRERSRHDRVLLAAACFVAAALLWLLRFLSEVFLLRE